MTGHDVQLPTPTPFASVGRARRSGLGFSLRSWELALNKRVQEFAMKIFLSYSSPDRDVAEEVQLALLGEGHEVFFDKDSLPAGGTYHGRIEEAIRLADLLIFLISPQSLAPGSYALTELKLARTKWRHPKDRVLPVRLGSTPWDAIPPYLKSVTILEPLGSVAAEVLAATAALGEVPRDQNASVVGDRQETERADRGVGTISSSGKTQILIAAIGLVGVLGAAALANWDKLFSSRPPTDVSVGRPKELSKIELGGIKGPDTASSGSPTLNTQCPEVTFVDYSKAPPESSIVRRCDP